MAAVARMLAHELGQSPKFAGANMGPYWGTFLLRTMLGRGDV